MLTEKQRAHSELLLLKGAITEMSADDQATIKVLAETIRSAVKLHGANGIMALALVGLELQHEAS